VAFSGTKVEVFYPKINTVQEFDIGKNRGLLDQFLLLGFGGSGKELANAYTITVKGGETIDGVATTHLVLNPKSSKVRELVKSVELWIPDGKAQPIRQKFVEPSDDYMEVTYRDLKLNPSLSASDLQLSLPTGVKREYPQR
jgi:outer membrane lipoprotein-sorting protein